MTDKVQESLALWCESKRRLDLAKRTVGTAIEQGEEATMEDFHKGDVL